MYDTRNVYVVYNLFLSRVARRFWRNGYASSRQFYNGTGNFYLYGLIGKFNSNGFSLYVVVSFQCRMVVINIRPFFRNGYLSVSNYSLVPPYRNGVNVRYEGSGLYMTL